MSRGRGGGFGRGANRGPFNDGPDPDYTTTELFPPQPPPIQSPLNKEERAIVSRFRSHREKLHNGPLYTVLPTTQRSDPFNDISRYSSKYAKQRRLKPKLDARPYVREFFPMELWKTLGIEETVNAGGKKYDEQARKKRKLLVFSMLEDIALKESEEGGEEGEENTDKGVLAGRFGDDDEEEEEPDEEFDDEDNDYDAEQYFDDGEDLGEGDDYAQDDGGGDDY